MQIIALKFWPTVGGTLEALLALLIIKMKVDIMSNSWAEEGFTSSRRRNHCGDEAGILFV